LEGHVRSVFFFFSNSLPPSPFPRKEKEEKSRRPDPPPPPIGPFSPPPFFPLAGGCFKDIDLGRPSSFHLFFFPFLGLSPQEDEGGAGPPIFLPCWPFFKRKTGREEKVFFSLLGAPSPPLFFPPFSSSVSAQRRVELIPLYFPFLPPPPMEIARDMCYTFLSFSSSPLSSR